MERAMRAMGDFAGVVPLVLDALWSVEDDELRAALLLDMTVTGDGMVQVAAFAERLKEVLQSLLDNPLVRHVMATLHEEKF